MSSVGLHMIRLISASALCTISWLELSNQIPSEQLIALIVAFGGISWQYSPQFQFQLQLMSGCCMSEVIIKVNLVLPTAIDLFLRKAFEKMKFHWKQKSCVVSINAPVSIWKSNRSDDAIHSQPFPLRYYEPGICRLKLCIVVYYVWWQTDFWEWSGIVNYQ